MAMSEEQDTTARFAPERIVAPWFRLGSLERLQLKNGLKVVIVERSDLPIVSAQLQIRRGGAALPPEPAGLAAFTADMLDEGTETRSALEIAEEVEGLGATLTSSAGWDASTIEFVGLARHVPLLLDIVADIVLRPVFPPEEFERVRSERITRIVREGDQPAVLADNAFAEALYGSGHPYGMPPTGTREALESFGVGMVREFHRTHYHAGNATLIVVGSVDRSELEPILEEKFGEWRAAPVQERPLPDPSSPAGTVIHLVDKPGAAQSEIRVGELGVARATGDYFALTVLNTILGGAFTSRLNMRLREEKGYTYGARSSFAMRRGRGPFVAWAAVHTPVTASAVADFVREIGRLREEGVTPEELDRARNYVALRLPHSFESVEDVTERISDQLLHGLPDDFYRNYGRNVLSVTAAQVMESAKRRLHPDRLTIVVVGDVASIEGPLRELGIGEVRVLGSPSRD